MAKTSLLTNAQIEELHGLAESGKFTQQALAEYYGISPRTVGRVLTGDITDGLEEHDDDQPEITEHTIRTQQKNQKLRDQLNLQRKMVRESGRGVNVLEELNIELVKTMGRHDMSRFARAHHQQSGSGSVAVLQLSDVHFGEIVDSLKSNKYNFQVASARLRQYVDKARCYFKASGVTSVLVAMTGDMINSDRRLDEVTTNADNRSKIIFTAVDILNQLILDLNQDFNVSVASICGNESRLGKDIGWVNFMASDNFDYTIHNILSYMHRESSGITFIKMDDPLECLVDVGGQHFLLVHGHNGLAKTARMETEVAKIRSKYANHGINVRMVICGHIHQAFVSDIFARSSGLPGSNAFSDNGLNLVGRASQNVHIVHQNGNIDSIKVDVQEIDEDHYYPYNLDTEAYKPKPRDQKTVTIQSVTI